MQQLTELYGGQVFHTAGDSFICVFADAVAALQSALQPLLASSVDHGFHVHDRGVARGAQRNVGGPLDEPRVALPLADETIRGVRNLVRQDHQPVVAAGNRRKCHGQLYAIPVGAVGLE